VTISEPIEPAAPCHHHHLAAQLLLYLVGVGLDDIAAQQVLDAYVAYRARDLCTRVLLIFAYLIVCEQAYVLVQEYVGGSTAHVVEQRGREHQCGTLEFAEYIAYGVFVKVEYAHPVDGARQRAARH